MAGKDSPQAGGPACGEKGLCGFAREERKEKSGLLAESCYMRKKSVRQALP